jgi:hypothetical protein
MVSNGTLLDCSGYTAHCFTIQIIWENVATSSEAIPSIHPSMDLFMDMGGGA